MNNQLQVSKLESVLINGDLSTLSPDEKVSYNNKVCTELGLNPLTKPFEYIRLNGKLTLYARKDCTDQLRKIHDVSIEIVDTKEINGVWCVTANAKLPNGRTDSSMGAVNIGKMTGDSLANALMKAETKAKRRVTLSICGLGLLDETELETIPAHNKSSSDINQRLAPPIQSEPIQPKQTPKPTVPVITTPKPAPIQKPKPTPAAKAYEKGLGDPGIFQIPDGWGRHAGKRLKELSKLEAEAYLGMLQQKGQRDELDGNGKRILFWLEQYARGAPGEATISQEQGPKVQ